MTDWPARPPVRRAVHGVTIGIMMLDTGFQRLPGDIGYAPTWPFPVHYYMVKGGTGARLLSEGGGGTLDLFLNGIDVLTEMGVDGIATSCGFLALFQREINARSKVPVATSSLLQVPMVEAILPQGKRVGILTADKAALTPKHFEAVRCPTDLPVVGMPLGGVFKTAFRAHAAHVDHAAQEGEALAMAAELLREHPEVGAIVCECTNLAPHSAKIQEVFSVPVFDVVTLVTWLHDGLKPRRFQ